MQEYRPVTCQSGGEVIRHRRAMIDIVLTGFLGPMLISAKSATSREDVNRIGQNRTKRKGSPEPEIQCGSHRLPVYGGADLQDVDLR